MALIELKSDLDPELRLSYDPEADAVYILLREGKSARTLEEADGVQIDLDKQGRLLGIEILWASDRHPDLDAALRRLATRYKVPSLRMIHPLKVPEVFANA